MARRQRTVRHQGHAHLFADGDQLPLILAVEQVVVVLHGREGGPAVVPGRQLHIVKLVAVHGRSAQRTDFASFDQPVQGFHGLLNGGVVVEAVDDVQVQIICTQTLQGAVNFPVDGLAGEPSRVEVDLGRNDHLVTGHRLFEGAAQILLAGAGRVAVGRIKEIDA